jgi:hypothetical protein
MLNCIVRNMILPIGTHLCDYFRLSRRNKNIEADDTLESIILNMQLIQMSSYPLVSSEVMVSLYHEQYLIFLPPSFHIPKILFYKNPKILFKKNSITCGTTRSATAFEHTYKSSA